MPRFMLSSSSSVSSWRSILTLSWKLGSVWASSDRGRGMPTAVPT